MTKTVVAVTGASGFIGSELTKFLKSEGYHVIALNRNSSSNKIVSEEYLFNLENPDEEFKISRIDILVHCAFIDHATNKNASALNLHGSLHLFNLARASGVKKIIFFSSVSAHEEALSVYGVNKWNIEKLLDTNCDAILKCSLVIGPGGLFKRMIQYALKRKIVPIFEKGKQPIQVIAIDNVLRAVNTIIQNNLSGAFVLSNKEKINYRQFFQIVGTHYGKRFLFLHVNLSFLKAMINFANRAGIKLPVSNENILGLQALRYMDPKKSLSLLQLHTKNLEEALENISISTLKD